MHEDHDWAHPGEIDVSGFSGLEGAKEFLRLWKPDKGGALCFVQPRNLEPDPFIFGMAMVDAIKHAARAGSQAVNVSEEEALKLIYEGFDAERGKATTDIAQIFPGKPN
jgi:hypothetical protein